MNSEWMAICDALNNKTVCFMDTDQIHKYNKQYNDQYKENYTGAENLHWLK